MTRTAYRTCPLCEACCGLELTVADEVIVGVRGDREHVVSKGFICPKGAAFGEVVHDPDRLRRPLVRGPDGWTEVDWPAAFAAVEAGLRPIMQEHGPQAVGVYLGNPNVHTMAGGIYPKPLVKALGTRNVFTASTVDQMPKHVSCGFLFGDPLAIPVPDLDRTDFLLMLGANPWESNGSLCTAPDFPGRVKAIQARGGTVVVVDPRRTRTAAHADEHLFIRPGTDAFLLFAIVQTLFAEGLVDLRALAPHVSGVAEVEALAKDFDPDRAAAACGIDAERIRGLAREIAAAPTAAVYGRLGTSTVEFGTQASWLIDVINVLTGNLDRPGGAMFPLAPHQARVRRSDHRGFRTGRWHSRVRRLPEVKSELPVAVLAEEITTTGAGQIRVLVTVAGNPVLSTPNSSGLDEALAGLDFMVCVDPYLNETTRHAHVILPPADPARSGHFDFAFPALAVRNYAAYSPPTLPPDPGGMDESDILARLALVAAGQDAAADPALVHEMVLHEVLRRATTDDNSPVNGRDPADLRAHVEGSGPAERIVDALLRVGAYGDGFGTRPDGLSLATLLANPHGVDLGPLQPRIPEILRTESGTVELCPEPIAADVPRLVRALGERRDGMVLIGRRHLRSNNSWLHNAPALMKGRDRCTLMINPDDAARLGLEPGDSARIRSRAGELVAPVEVTADLMEGVVSLPHGWGHGLAGVRLSVAAAHAGVNSNVLADDVAVDPLSGNAVLNGIPVRVEPAG